MIEITVSVKAHCAKLRQNGYSLTKSGVVGMYSEVQIMRSFYMMIPLILIMIGPITESNVK